MCVNKDKENGNGGFSLLPISNLVSGLLQAVLSDNENGASQTNTRSVITVG